MLNIGLESQQQIRGADGTILWRGGQVTQVEYQVKNSDVSAAPDIVMGEAVVWDPASAAGVPLLTLPRQETTAINATPTADLPMSLNLCVRRNTGATDPTVAGVALERIGRSSAGASGTLAGNTVFNQGFIAGVGSLVTAISTTAAIALGASVGPSATVGSVAANATAGCIVGTCIKINTAGVTGTGSTSWVGIHVSPR